MKDMSSAYIFSWRKNPNLYIVYLTINLAYHKNLYGKNYTLKVIHICEHSVLRLRAHGGQKLKCSFHLCCVYYGENVWYFYFLLKFYGKIEKEKENQPSQSNICS